MNSGQAKTGGQGRGPRIGIVGGGAAGCLVAVNLLRMADSPLEIDLIDASGDFGPGIPYRTTNPEHRLNVPAARMSALADDPDHYLNWRRARDPEAAPEEYTSRSIYGEYLKELLAETEDGAGAQSLNRVTGRVIAVENDDERPVIVFDDRRTEVDHIVIATGPVPGADPVPIPDSLKQRGIYIASAWDSEAIEAASGDEEVLIIGTGLTMVDVALSLAGGGGVPVPGGPRVLAVSRSGLFPKTHLKHLTRLSTPVIPAEGPVSKRQLLGAFAELLAEASARGGNWRDAIDSMRLVTGDAWRRMPVEDRRWLLENVNRPWEVHRYRMAPSVGARFHELLDSGQVRVERARIGSIEESGARARVRLDFPERAESFEFDRVISACGASTDIRCDAPEPVRGLIEAGHLRPDGLLLGVDVDRDGAARSAGGKRSEKISVLGSLRRGVDWESIGVTELKTQSRDIAVRLTKLF
ncbi:MAG: FAD/NAD(P)-binding protein [Thermoleophilales bacterium]|nr:FAD/NAD(P)-binding protein [Thermoleophilales bacterium]